MPEPDPPTPPAPREAALLNLRFAECRWLKDTDVAKLVWGKNTGQYRGQVAKMCDAGTFVTNGQAGDDRRIDALSVVARKLAEPD